MYVHTVGPHVVADIEFRIGYGWGGTVVIFTGNPADNTFALLVGVFVAAISSEELVLISPAAVVPLVLIGTSPGTGDAGLSATSCIVQPWFADPVAAYAPALPACSSSIRLELKFERVAKPEPAVQAQSPTQ